MRRLKVILSYDGTNYHGFQRQGRNLPCIQDVLFEAIDAVCDGPPQRFAAAGRTDAGVHAAGQVIAFDTVGSVPTERVAQALNVKLPGDVRALSAVEVARDFHPRFDALAKEYVYTIQGFNGREPHALLTRWALQVRGALDLVAMDRAARSLVGTYDCSSFQDAGRPVRDATRSIMECTVRSVRYHDAPWTGVPAAQISIRADGFLLHMVRVIAGTLVAVGRGRFAAEDIPAIAAAKDRRAAGPTLPPVGLCLMRVIYAEPGTLNPLLSVTNTGATPVDTPGTVA